MTFSSSLCLFVAVLFLSFFCTDTDFQLYQTKSRGESYPFESSDSVRYFSLSLTHSLHLDIAPHCLQEAFFRNGVRYCELVLSAAGTMFLKLVFAHNLAFDRALNSQRQDTHTHIFTSSCKSKYRI